jgi:hypothetical protein
MVAATVTLKLRSLWSSVGDCAGSNLKGALVFIAQFSVWPPDGRNILKMSAPLPKKLFFMSVWALCLGNLHIHQYLHCHSNKNILEVRQTSTNFPKSPGAIPTFYVPELWREASSTPKGPHFCSDQWTSPSSGAFSWVLVKWYLFCMLRKDCNKYFENIRSQGIKYSYVGDRAPWICTPL